MLLHIRLWIFFSLCHIPLLFFPPLFCFSRQNENDLAYLEESEDDRKSQIRHESTARCCTKYLSFGDSFVSSAWNHSIISLCTGWLSVQFSMLYKISRRNGKVTKRRSEGNNPIFSGIYVLVHIGSLMNHCDRKKGRVINKSEERLAMYVSIFSTEMNMMVMLSGKLKEKQSFLLRH